MSRRSETLTVAQVKAQERLDHYLRRIFPMVSRSALQRLIEQGHIKVNGQIVKPTHHPRSGELIDVHWPEARPAETQPQDIPLDVIHEDADLLVVNKPPGLVIHPGAGHDEHTLVNALLHHCRGQLSGIGGVARPGIVHRLDKETSGCIVVAKNDRTHVALADQFAGRTTEKNYLAIVCGELPRESGDIRAAIARHPTHRKRMAVTNGSGRAAWTSYRVRERLLGATFVEAMLHTGRTHQIRVHLQHLGFPLVGDATYGARQNKRLQDMTGFTAPRVMLHAYKLGFVHPTINQRVSYTAAMPKDFKVALAALKKEA